MNTINQVANDNNKVILPPISNILNETIPRYYGNPQMSYQARPRLPPIHKMGPAEPVYQSFDRTYETAYKHKHEDKFAGSRGTYETNYEPKSLGASKRKTRNNLPKETTYILINWLNDHLNHPYPNLFEKNQLMASTGLNHQQLLNWFINARRRKIKMLKEQRQLNS